MRPFRVKTLLVNTLLVKTLIVIGLGVPMAGAAEIHIRDEATGSDFVEIDSLSLPYDLDLEIYLSGLAGQCITSLTFGMYSPDDPSATYFEIIQRERPSPFAGWNWYANTSTVLDFLWPDQAHNLGIYTVPPMCNWCYDDVVILRYRVRIYDYVPDGSYWLRFAPNGMLGASFGWYDCNGIWYPFDADWDFRIDLGPNDPLGPCCSGGTCSMTTLFDCPGRWGGGLSTCDDVTVSVTDNPDDVELCAGEPLSLEVSVAALPSADVQWFKDEVMIPDATDTSYQVAAVDPDDAGEYRVEASNGCETAISGTATVTVREHVTLVPLADVTTTLGSTAQLTAHLRTGTEPLTYQWRKKTVPLSDDGHVTGTQSATLTIHDVTAADLGAYDVIITGPCNALVSQSAELALDHGDCPPAGPPHVYHTYRLRGSAKNTPWSWRIDPAGDDWNAPSDLNVPGVPSGGALAVAQQFAESINAYALAGSCATNQLVAGARAVFGRDILGIRTGGGKDFTLSVGPAGQEPSCDVVPERLPACGFNPEIRAAGGTMSANSSSPDPDAPAGPPAGATAETTAEPMTSDEQVMMVLYNPHTGEETLESAGTTHDAALPTDVGPLATGSTKPPRPTGTEAFDGLRLITEYEVYPPGWAAAKIWYTPAGTTDRLEASGTLVGPRHVLTTGRVVSNGQGDWNEDIVAGFGIMGPNQPGWKDYEALTLATTDAWRYHADNNQNVGLIVLDKPVGGLEDKGWNFVSAVPSDDRDYCDFVFNDLLGFGMPFEGCVFPVETPYLDDRLYWQHGVFDDCDWIDEGENPSASGASYDGMDGGGMREVCSYNIYFVIDSPPGQASRSTIRFIDIFNNLRNALNSAIDLSTPDGPDLVPFDVQIGETDILAGGEDVDTMDFYVYNQGETTSYIFSWQVFLSTDDQITPSDTLLAEGAFDDYTDPQQGHRIEVHPTPVIPEGTLEGDYYIGVIITEEDGVNSNNDTSGIHAVPINVQCGPMPGPSNVQASDGTYQSMVVIEWDEVPDAYGYRVYRAIDLDAPKILLTDHWGVKFPRFEDRLLEGATHGTRYHYWVGTIDSCGISSPLDGFHHDDGYAGLAQVVGVEASDGEFDDRIRITWNPVPGAVSYDVYRNDRSNPDTAYVVGNVAGTSFDYMINDPGELLYFWVRANNWGSGELSLPDTGFRKLDPPFNINATDGEYDDHIFVNWDSDAYTHHFRVYRSTSFEGGEPWDMISDWMYDEWFEDYTADPGRTYYYFVQGASHHTGYPSSDISTEHDAGWRDLLPPDYVNASDGVYTAGVRITWGYRSGIQARVFRHTIDDPDTATLISGWESGSSFFDRTATPGVTYYYWVECRAIGETGNISPKSNVNTGWRAEDCNHNGYPDHLPDDDPGPPDILAQPVSVAAGLGEYARFYALAIDWKVETTYQWRKDGHDIPGANWRQLTFRYVVLDDAGTYDVVITNDCGQTISDPATLTVLETPVITLQPVDVTVDLGGTASFTVTATGAEPLTYAWRKDGLVLADNDHITGSTTDTLILDPTEYADGGLYDCVVSVSPTVYAISDTATLTVNTTGCPGDGPRYIVNTYMLTGNADGTDFSWRLSSTTSPALETGSVNVPAVAGDALAVAQAIATRINNYASANGCSSTRLMALADTIAGTVTLSVRTGVATDFALYVGSEPDAANEFVDFGLPPVTFSATIEQLPLPGTDCNANGWDDFLEISGGLGTDCDENGVLDECDILAGLLTDADGNNLPDQCLMAAASRKSHGSAGEQNLALPIHWLDDFVGSEPRPAGPTHLILSFGGPVQPIEGAFEVDDVTLIGEHRDGGTGVETAQVTAVNLIGSQLEIELNGVSDGTQLSVMLDNLQDQGGHAVDDLLCFGVLYADTEPSPDGEIGIFDLLRVRNLAGQPATDDTSDADLDLTGSIDVFDLIEVRNNLGHTCPMICP